MMLDASCKKHVLLVGHPTNAKVIKKRFCVQHMQQLNFYEEFN